MVTIATTSSLPWSTFFGSVISRIRQASKTAAHSSADPRAMFKIKILITITSMITTMSKIRLMTMVHVTITSEV